MKKLVLSILIIGISQAGFAKGGIDSPQEAAFKNSQAGFVSESLEHSLEQFVRANPELKDSVQDASVVSETPEDSVVTISLSDGNAVTFTCAAFDDWSNSGTVLKKEVVCRRQ